MKKTTVLFCFSIFMLSSIQMSYASKKETEKKTMEESTYSLDFSAAGCSFSVEVNNIPILSLDLKNGQTGSVVPLNQGIFKSGTQELSLTINSLPGEQEKSYANASLKTKVVHDWNYKDRDKIKPILEAVLGVGAKTGTDIKGKTLPYTEKFKFQAEVPYVENTLDSAVNLLKIAKGDATVKAYIMKIHEEILAMIEKKEYDKLKTLSEANLSRIAKILYLSEEDKKNRADSLGNMFSENKFKATPIPSDAVVKYYAYGKLAQLENKNGENAFIFKGEDGTVMHLTFFFYLPEKDQTKMRIF